MHLNKILYFGDFVACPVAILVLAYATFPMNGPWNWGGWLLLAGAGLLGWTFLEYVIHRWVYHHYPPFKHYHDMHHADPQALVGAPSFISILLILGCIGAPLSMLGPVTAGGITTGVLVGYWGYVVIHHAGHHWRPRKHSHLNVLRRWHARHHHAPRPCNFGITTTLWDYLFGTPFAGVRHTATRSLL